MASNFGSTIRVALFGQSHSAAVGVVVEGLPVGFSVDQARLDAFMQRRAPGHSAWATPRKEADKLRIVSGLNPAGQTCGAPLCGLIENTNTRSQDYETLKRIPRPGHADFTAQMKWHGYQDVAGGGHFSGRLTAGLCIAGGIALQLLDERYGIHVAAHIQEIVGIADTPFEAYNTSAEKTELLTQQMELLAQLPATQLPVLNKDADQAMRQAIAQVKEEQDSVGGIIECVTTGIPAGIGGPLFDGIESALARAVFGIGAVKGIEFGRGFAAARMHGSEHNDAYTIHDGKPCCVSNNAGGNLGGITTGAPLLFRIAVKPTSSIARPQHSVDMSCNELANLEIVGRHDPCIVPRAVPVLEATTALVVLDQLLSFPVA